MKKKQTIFDASITGIALLFLFLIWSGKSVQAQAGDSGGNSELSLSFKTGLSSGTFTGERFIEVSNARNGVHVAAGINYMFSETLGLSLDIGYIRSGATKLEPDYFYAPENIDPNNLILKTDVITNALNVPLGLILGIPGTRTVKPFIVLGGDFSYYFGSKALNTRQYTLSDKSYIKTEFSNLGDRIKPIDIGVLAGTGFEIEGTTINYLFEMNYRVGLFDINNVQSAMINSNLQNNIFSISCGIAFKL